MARIRRAGPAGARPPDPEGALRAIETVMGILPLLDVGVPLIRASPDGFVHVDVPLVYDGVALDRLHFDPLRGIFAPKGWPVRVRVDSVDRAGVMDRARELLGELRVIDAVEYREPERCWVVPLAWESFIVAHVRVDADGEEVVPDYALTAEMSGGLP